MNKTTVKSLGQSLDHIERYLNKMWRDADSDTGYDLSFNEYDYARCVYEQGTPRLSDLAEVMCVSRPSATNMVRKLEKKGLLERTRCPEDARSFRISVTDNARRMFERDQEMYGSLTGKIRGAMSREEFQSLEKLLSKVCDAL